MKDRKDITQKLLIGLYIVGAVILAYFVVPKAIVIFLPFILAYVIALIASPIVRFLNEKLKVPKKLAAGICTLVIIAIIGFLVYFIVFRVVLYIQDIAANWDSIKDFWINVGNLAYEKINVFYSNASPEIQEYLDMGMEAALKEIQTLFAPIVNAAISFTTNFAMSIPSGIIFTIVMFLATYFILGEAEVLENIALKVIGERNLGRIKSVYKDMMHALGGYVKAQLIIMSIVAVPLMIGLYIAGVEHFIFIAALIAVFDALPVFGSGAVLIPWSIFGLITGDYKVCIVMLILYFVIIITRQMLEPKIVGKHIGIPPILTLVLMYGGLKLFGIVGMILGPVCALVLKNLYTSGVFGYVKNRRNDGKAADNDGKGDLNG